MESSLVTGASRGIGREIARTLARRGHGLTITARKLVDLDAAATELHELGAPEVVTMACDMADRDSLPGLVKAHDAAFGTMTALVLNAGVGTAGDVARFDMRRFDKTLEVNLAAPFVLLQESLPMLRAAAAADPARGARVVAMSSITGAYAEAGLAVYGAAKAAVMSLVETVNLEESASGVVATAIAPAFVDTDMSAWAADQVPTDQMIPVRDVARVVELLLDLSPRSVINTLVMSRSGTNGYCA